MNLNLNLNVIAANLLVTQVLLDDGIISLVVTDVTHNDITCMAENGMSVHNTYWVVVNRQIKRVQYVMQ